MSRLRRLVALAAFSACDSPASDLPDGGIDGGADPRAPVLYPAGQTLSPLTPDLVERLRAVHATATGSDMVFAKIGDSHTETPAYIACFAGTNVDLGGRDLGATVAHFKAGDAAGTTPFQRVSIATKIGWSAFQVLAGTPSPLAQEVAAIRPTFATVLFGTNDIGYNRIDRYGQNLAAIADTLLASGVIPIFSTLPPRDDDAAADRQVPRYNAIARGVAQTRGIPLVDLHRELAALPGHGLAGDDLHLESYSAGACRLDAMGITHGNNVRNLWVLSALDRMRRTVLADEPAPDADAPRLRGRGAPDDPFLVSQLPFADRRDTSTFGTDAITSYPACGPQDERGNEVYYRIELASPAMLHAYVIDDTADIDLHLLADAPSASGCLARGDTAIDRQLAAGTYFLVADTFAGTAGDFTIVVMTDP
ncbi:MAG: SGNH/GDSL hydrolase family protein [Deltaproteobacteria bacterium]|nr:SGNH/GDSL hydrolase family protein [Deltaproteobacteria bacterium]